MTEKKQTQRLPGSGNSSRKKGSGKSRKPPGTAEFQILSTGFSDIGKERSRNEDRWLADDSLRLFAVSDGMGGTSGGELAAQLVTELLPEMMQQVLLDAPHLRDDAVAKLASGVVADLSERVKQESEGHPGFEGMGATVVLCLLRPQSATFVHLGDSRAYLYRDHQLQQLTVDHSLAQVLLDAAEISLADFHDHPARHQLTRYVGMPGEPLPDCCVITPAAGDTLLLCSDGLTGMLNDEEIMDFLSQPEPPEVICSRLVSAANAAGGRDNITAVIVTLKTN
jgi:PPM family protein phosphatase